MSTNKKDEKEIISQGIEALIEKLKTEGVTAGQKEAKDIVKQAKKQADQIIYQARTEAEMLVTQAHGKIQQEKQAAEDALGLAARNMRLELRQRLIDRFRTEVQRLVHKELSSEDTIRQLILILAIDTAEQLQKFKEKEIAIQLPQAVLDFDKIRENPNLLTSDALKLLVQNTTNQMLRQGVTLTVNTENKNEVGMKVRIVDEDIEMDLTEDAINQLLLKHMQPRFRALLEGLLR